jgi:hypothetical protein
MTQLFGRDWTRHELMERVGDISQLGGIRTVTLNDGKENGVRAVEVRTGTEFRFTVLPDRGMDISDAEYAGRSLCWRSCTGDVARAFFEPRESGGCEAFSVDCLQPAASGKSVHRARTKARRWVFTGGSVIFPCRTSVPAGSGRAMSI